MGDGSILEDIQAAAAELPGASTETAEPGQATEPVAAATEAVTSEGTETAAEARARDDKGRFAAKERAARAKEGKVADVAADMAPAKPGEVPPLAAVAEAAEPKPVTPPAEALKAPASWKPAAREKWPTVAPELQQEIVRVDRELRTTMQESAEARKFHQSFREVVAPFEGMIRAEGGEPLRAVAGLLQTAAALRTAPPAHKAQLVANIVRSYGINIDMLASALDGETSQSGPGQSQPQGQFQDPRFDQLIAQMQQAKQRQAQATQAETMKSVEAFTAKAEFIGEVREEMADLIEMAARRGVVLSLDDAYNRATAMHPEVSKVLAQREAAKAANANSASTQRARAAASSVRTQPAAAPPRKSGNSILEDIQDSAAALSGRG